MGKKNFRGEIIFSRYHSNRRRKKCIVYTLSDLYNLFQFIKESKYKDNKDYQSYKAYKSLKDMAENLEYKKETYLYLKDYILNTSPLNKKQKDILFYLPLKKVPLFINDEDSVLSLISIWRLNTGK